MATIKAQVTTELFTTLVTSVINSPQPTTVGPTKGEAAQVTTVWLPAETTLVLSTIYVLSTEAGAPIIVATLNAAVLSPTSSASSTFPPGSTNSTGVGFSKQGVPAGTVAGVAIGVAFVIALLTFAATYLFFRRRHQQSQVVSRSRRRRRSSHKGRDLDQKGGYNVEETGEHHVDGTIVIEDHLPQPLSDKTIINEVATLNTLIAQHVANFYHRNAVNASAIVRASTAPNVGISQDQLVGLMAAPGTRQIGLRIYITAVILDCILVDGDLNRTLLPTEIVAMVRNMPTTGIDPAVRKESLTRWLVLTSFLLFPTSDGFPKDSHSDAFVHQREARIDSVASLIGAVLQPFIPRGREDAQIEHLREIAKRVARLGLTLLGQPGGWRFAWTSARTRGGVCVFPALLRGDELEREAEVEMLG